MTSELDLAAFAPHEGTVFQVDVGQEEPFNLELIEVASIKLVDANRDPSVRQEPFRLTFRGGSPESYLSQQVFKMKHQALGELEIFIVPIGPDADGMCYEAIFN